MLFLCCSLILMLFVVSVGAPVTSPDSAFAAGTVNVNPEDNIQQAVDNNPPGTTFIIKAGVHRFQTIVPKNDSTFVGERGPNGERLSVLSGAKVLTSFTRQGNLWVAADQTQQGVQTSYSEPKCLENPNDRDFWTGHTDPSTNYTGCVFPEDLFIDNVPLWHVTSLSEVVPGKWYFDYAGHKIYFADDPTGRSVETSVTQYAFRQGGSNVTISGLVIEKYAVPAQAEAVFAADGWLVEDNEIRFNHGRGVLAGSGTRLLGNNIHHNGQLGISVVGDGAIIDGNEIAYNNFAGYSVNWEAGGAKFVTGATNLVFRNNNVHHNNGNGVWGDWVDTNNTFEGNRITDNGAAGLLYEASFSATIRNNVVERNGFTYKTDSIYYGGGIRLLSSADVEIYGNTVANNRHGIIAVHAELGSNPRGLGRLELRNLNAHDNAIIQNQGIAAGLGDDTGSGEAYTTTFNNHFDYSNYQLMNPSGDIFEWQNHTMDRTGWQAAGQDLHSFYAAVSGGTPTPTHSSTSTRPPSPAPTPRHSPTPTVRGVTATPADPLWGDLNCDGVVGPADLMLGLELAVGLRSSLTCEASADIDCNAVVNGLDMLDLLRFISHLPSLVTGNCPAIGVLEGNKGND